MSLSIRADGAALVPFDLFKTILLDVLAWFEYISNLLVDSVKSISPEISKSTIANFCVALLKTNVLSSAKILPSNCGAVIVPSIVILPIPVILLLLMSRLLPSCGDVSATTLFKPATAVPPIVDPSPTKIFFVSVVYTNSPSIGVTSSLSASVPRLSLKAIYRTPEI